LDFGRLFSKRHKKSDQFWALRNVSFELPKGAVLAVIGCNGSGKSTLLKLLSRVMLPTEGEAWISGRIGSLLEVGTGFHPELTGRENIFLSGALIGMRRHEVRQRFDEIVNYAGIEASVDTPVKHYSSGMYARLGFSVAAHLDAEVLFIDEVLAVGDVEFQRRCFGKMAEVARDGRTVVLVSHNMGAVQRLSSHALLLSGGQATWMDRDVNTAISRYLQTGGGISTSWTRANHDVSRTSPWFTLESFALVNQDDTAIVGPVTGNDDVYLKIVGRVAQRNKSLCVGFALYGPGEELLMYSFPTDLPDSERILLVEGMQVLRVRLPVELLNSGVFRVEFSSSLFCTEWICAPGSGAPSLRLEVAGVGGHSSFRLHPREGLCSPVLSWCAQKIDGGS